MNVTTLDALLLFLVAHKGQSGYDVRQLMQGTPLGLFSDSPGAIYPALARLEQRGLLASAAEPQGRRKRIYERTDAGEAVLTAWLARPVEADDVQKRGEELTLRYVMTAETLGRGARWPSCARASPPRPPTWLRSRPSAADPARPAAARRARRWTWASACCANGWRGGASCWRQEGQDDDA